MNATTAWLAALATASSSLVTGPAQTTPPKTPPETPPKAAQEAAQEAAQGCAGTLEGVVSDFDGDGHADAVVGDPQAAVSGRDRAGVVTVMYGDAGGRIGEGRSERLTQDSPGIPGTAESGDLFGFALEPVNLDGDGCTDLVVGVPHEDIGATVGAGAVTVLYGSPGGLGRGRPALWVDQDTPGVPGAPERTDQFGSVLTAAPAKGYDAATVVVGAPYEDIGAVPDAGGMVAMWFTDSGRVAAAHWFDQDTPGVPSTPEPDDLFGSDIELTQVSGSSGRWDLIVGAPYEDVRDAPNAGSLTRIEDIAEPVSEYEARTWTQDTGAVAGSVEAGDFFGSDPESVVTPEGSYLAVGVPGEDLRGAENGGMVQIFRASGDGLAPQRVFHQGVPGAAGGVEDDDYFGQVLEGVERPTSGGDARVVVGLPYEDLGGVRDAGAVQSFSLDARDVRDRWISQSDPGVPGSADRDDRFGAALATAGNMERNALLVGVPAEDGHGVVNVLPYGGGDARIWYPGRGGVPGDADRFGFALAGHR